MKNFKTFLKEAYNFSRCDEHIGIEKDLCNWFYNEQTLNWNSSKIKEAKERFGGVNVGIIYRGAKINTPEELTQYKKVANGGTINFNSLVSATDSKSEAQTFAWYIKSYDELTMLYGLMSAIRRGSAGKYGSVLLTLKPSKNEVIVKSYEEGNEKRDNPNWENTLSSPENEVLLFGNVRVVKAEIAEPLTKENWKDILWKTINSVSDLSNDFVARWIRENRIPENEINDFVIKILPRIIHTEDDIADFLSIGSIFFNRKIYSNYPPIEKFIGKYFVVNDHEIGVVYNGKPLTDIDDVLFSSNLDKLITKEFSLSILKKIQDVEFSIRRNSFIAFGSRKFSAEEIRDNIYTFTFLYQKSNTFKSFVESNSIFRKIIASLDKIIEQILLINPDYIEENNITKYDIYELLGSLDDIIQIHPKEQQMRQKIFQHLYNNLAPSGTITPKLQNAISIFEYIVDPLFKFGTK